MTLAHDVAGDGPAVLLLHSTVVDRRMWDPQVPALVTAGFRAVRCDLNGFGDSPLPTGLYNDADDVLATLATLGVGDFAIVGASGGGRVALEIAARRPSRVSALLLLCTAVRGFEPGPFLDLIEAEQITQVFGLPMMYRAALEHPSFAGRDLSTLRRAAYAMARARLSSDRRSGPSPRLVSSL